MLNIIDVLRGKLMKHGFTLAEVLITLGIIGVVSAITLPTLIKNYKKKETVAKLQKAISVLNQAYRLSNEETGESLVADSVNMDPQEYFETYWAPYIKTLTYCKSPRACGYTNYTPFKKISGANSSWYVVEPRLRSTFLTPEGVVYVIFLASWKSKDGGEKIAQPQILVDLNGSNKPNQYGKDVFWLSRGENEGEGIQPYCHRKTNSEIITNCSKTGEGSCCAEMIRRASWTIPKNYPW